LCKSVTARVKVVEERRECNKTTEFECAPRVCIPIEDQCDGVKHCGNGKDEENCKSITVIKNYYFFKGWHFFKI
jgi:hypothetical protein